MAQYRVTVNLKNDILEEIVPSNGAAWIE